MEEESLTKKEKRELVKEEKQVERERGEMMGKIKKYFLIFIVLAVVLGLGYKLIRYINTPLDNNVSSDLVVTDKDYIKGKSDAKLTLFEFGDFECPACANYAPFVKKLSEDFPNDLRIVYRHFPLPQHKNAVPSSKAAESAGRQGKFWEMAETLYSKQDEWVNLGNPKDKFVSYAQDLGLDTAKFSSDYDDKAIEDKINSNTLLATRLRINSTPTFYLNGQVLPPVGSYEEFKAQIEKELQKS